NSWEHRIGNNKRVENTFLEAGRVYETTVKFREDRGTAMAVFDMTNPSGSRTETGELFSPYYPPTISITPDNSYVNNGNEGYAARFRISADRTADRDIYLKYDNNIFNNGATSSDAGYSPGTIRLPAGQREAFFEIPLASDDWAEEASSEQIRITLQKDGPSYLLSGNNSAAINIKDIPVVNIIDSRQAEEGKTNGAFILDFNNPTTRNFDLQFQLSGDAKVNTTTTATPGNDYNLSYIAQNANGQDIGRVTVNSSNNIYTMTVPTGSKKIVVNVEPINDEIAEPEYENVNLQLLLNTPSNVSQGYRLGNTYYRNLRVIDNEPTVSLGKVVMPQEGFGYGSTIQDLGAALEVNGSSHISIADNEKLNLSKTGQFTQEAWIFASINDNRQRGILGYQTSANDPQTYPSIWQQGNNIQVGFGDGQKFQSFTASNVLNQNTWNHVATTFDGQKYRLYVNGVEVFVDERWQGSKLPNTQQLNIGKVDNNFFAGTIDEVRIWNVARSAGDIQNAMLTPLSGSEQGLVGYWQFENNLNDLSNQGSAISQTPANGVFNGGVQYINNPSPQIGYIEVNLDKPFTGPQGLWVKYNIGGGATQNVDYFNSRYRRLSTDPTSERNGIIIPQGQTSAKIYFVAKPDQIDEPDENIT
ncbi:MAG: LamG domain-containing protein, partial [Microcoleaceae cyanobacterium]